MCIKLLVEWKENQAGERDRESEGEGESLGNRGEKCVLRGRKWSTVSDNAKSLSNLETEMTTGLGELHVTSSFVGMIPRSDEGKTDEGRFKGELEMHSQWGHRLPSFALTRRRKTRQYPAILYIDPSFYFWFLFLRS